MDAVTAAITGITMIATQPALPYNAGLQAARDRGFPLVTFAHCQPRPVAGCVVAHVPDGVELPGVPGERVVVCVFGPGARASYSLPADATDAQILAAVKGLRDSLSPARRYIAEPPPYLHRMVQGYDPSCRTG